MNRQKKLQLSRNTSGLVERMTTFLNISSPDEMVRFSLITLGVVLATSPELPQYVRAKMDELERNMEKEMRNHASGKEAPKGEAGPAG